MEGDNLQDLDIEKKERALELVKGQKLMETQRELILID